MITFGIGANAQFTFAKNELSTFLSVNFSWGLAVTAGILVAGKVSGKHSKILYPHAFFNVHRSVVLSYMTVHNRTWLF